jgi:hypothetical protein
MDNFVGSIKVLVLTLTRVKTFISARVQKNYVITATTEIPTIASQFFKTASPETRRCMSNV